VDHEIRDISARNAAAPTGGEYDLLSRTASTLRIGDGMMGALTTMSGHPGVYRPAPSLWGHGGECLRGGWMEYVGRPAREDVDSLFERNWDRFPVFVESARRQQVDFATSWTSAHLAQCGPGDVLDIAYLYFRVGRWVAAGSRGSDAKFLPFLDNRFSREVLSMDGKKKRSHYLHRELIARLLPAVADLPLANKFWNGTPVEERERLRTAYPEAFTEEKGKAPAVVEIGLAPEVVAHIRTYLVREGRLDLLADVLDADRMKRQLEDPDRPAQAKRLFLGAYTAAVLVSEDWRFGAPTRPVSIAS